MWRPGFSRSRSHSASPQNVSLFRCVAPIVPSVSREHAPPPATLLFFFPVAVTVLRQLCRQRQRPGHDTSSPEFFEDPSHLPILGMPGITPLGSGIKLGITTTLTEPAPWNQPAGIGCAWKHWGWVVLLVGSTACASPCKLIGLPVSSHPHDTRGWLKSMLSTGQKAVQLPA